jgi:hypothetical protein
VVATREETAMSDATAWPADRRITIRDLQAATEVADRQIRPTVMPNAT